MPEGWQHHFGWGREGGCRPQGTRLILLAAQVLYDFCMARGELREAAAAQLALARRLREEAPSALDPLQHALSALHAPAAIPAGCVTCYVHHACSLLWPSIIHHHINNEVCSTS